MLDRHTNHTITAVPTKYKKNTYRSRTEARWAVFFDCLNVPFAYEQKCFRTPEGGYLPDFLLWPKSSDGCFIEIKGPEPIERDYVRARSVERQSKKKLRFLVGTLPTTAHPSGTLSRHWSEKHGVWVQGFWRVDGWTMRLRQEALDEARNFEF